ncbi:unnamed protein product [Orchesella dallaii]|uniref:Uncharacterized protein n=1 Tax=Orchesella dallaii TaxID=48710 RepID=A0ABP1QCS2_9HEXA
MFAKHADLIQSVSDGNISLVRYQRRPFKFNLFHWWILLGYYSLCIPFKPVVTQNGLIQLKTNKIQKIISLFGIWVLNFIVLATDILEDITKLWATATPRAASYLYVVQIFILSAKHLNVFWILATKKHEIEILLSRLYSYSFSRIKELDKQMTRFKGLLLNRSVKEKFFADKEEWGRLVQELELKPIGIGAEGLYLINYGFLSQLLVLVITLFVIGFE